MILINMGNRNSTDDYDGNENDFFDKDNVHEYFIQKEPVKKEEKGSNEKQPLTKENEAVINAVIKNNAC